MLSVLFKLAVRLLIIFAAGWAILVALHAPILDESFRLPVACLLSCIFLLALIKPARYVIPAFVCVVAVFVFWARITPTNNGNWQTDVAQLPWVEQNGDNLTFHNVRDFNFRTETDFDARYVTKNVRLSELSSVDLFASYWAGKNIAHIIVSFGFKDLDYISVSIEARKTKDQSYSTIAGFFRNFKLIYVVAEERDLIGLRTRFRQPNEQVYILRGRFNRTKNTKFLQQYILKINKLKETPAFYNTLTTNCTTQVLQNAQVGNPLLRYNWRLLLSGYTPEYLYNAGSLGKTMPLEKIMEKGLVNARAQDVSNAQLFSKNIREGVPRPPAIEP